MPGVEDQVAAAVHVVGFLLAAILGAGLLRMSRRLALTVAKRRSIVVFLLAWLALYATSVAFHLAADGALRRVLMAFDQGAIFILIAAGWAPLAPFRMSPGQGRGLVVALWSLAGVGIALSLVAGFVQQHAVLHRLAFGLYLIQAALPLMFFGEVLWRRLSPASVAYIGGSMIIYGVGLVFYRLTGMAWHHVVWHLAIVLGCLLNFAGFRRLLSEDMASSLPGTEPVPPLAA